MKDSCYLEIGEEYEHDKAVKTCQDLEKITSRLLKGIRY